MIKKYMEKKGQVTLFVIISILIVSAILIYFLWAKPNLEFRGSEGLRLESCIRDAMEQSIENLAPTAGFANPEFVYLYDNTELPYLCYTNEDYMTCTMQKPFIKQHFEKQMENILRQKIQTCYSSSLDDLKSKGYNVISGDLDYNFLIEPGIARVELQAPTSIGSQGFERFNIELNTPIYEMIMIATSILQSESKYGDSDISTLMILYPENIIDKIKQEEGTTIYIIQNKNYNIKLQFASRSVAWPAGYSR
jgi:nitrogen fixation-related uncharacterized protein